MVLDLEDLTAGLCSATSFIPPALSSFGLETYLTVWSHMGKLPRALGPAARQVF